MKGIYKYLISLFLVSLLLFKGTGILLTVFPSAFKDLLLVELMMEGDQEKKESSKSETAPDELFEKALLPADSFLFIIPASGLVTRSGESLPDVYLDTLTPPPNAVTC